MNEMKSDTYTQSKKLICDWTDAKIYLIRYSMLKVYVRHGMIVEKVHATISLPESKWSKKHNNLYLQKTTLAKSDSEKDFYNLLHNAFYGKTMENVRNRTNVEFIKRDHDVKKIKQQSKSNFKGTHKSFTN